MSIRKDLEKISEIPQNFLGRGYYFQRLSCVWDECSRNIFKAWFGVRRLITLSKKTINEAYSGEVYEGIMHLSRFLTKNKYKFLNARTWNLTRVTESLRLEHPNQIDILMVNILSLLKMSADITQVKRFNGQQNIWGYNWIARNSGDMERVSFKIILHIYPSLHKVQKILIIISIEKFSKKKFISNVIDTILWINVLCILSQDSWRESNPWKVKI